MHITNVLARVKAWKEPSLAEIRQGVMEKKDVRGPTAMSTKYEADNY